MNALERSCAREVRGIILEADVSGVIKSGVHAVRRPVRSAFAIGFFLILTLMTGIGHAALDWKGISYTSFWSGQYLPVSSETELDAIKNTGANIISLLTTWYQANETSSTIYSNTGRTHSYAEIRDAVNDAANRGLKVCINFHVDCDNGAWRGNINPAAPDTWFASYKRAITNYARIAQDNISVCPVFSMGCELRTLSVSGANRNRWTNVIRAVTNIYKGELVYMANWDEWNLVTFNSNLDYIGIDAYFPIDESQSPTLLALQNGWENANVSGYYGQNWVQQMSNFIAAKQPGKRIIFTEVGCTTSDYGAKNPWQRISTTLNTNLQDRYFYAMFSKLANRGWFAGAFCWEWDPDNTDGPGTGGYTNWGLEQKRVSRSVAPMGAIPTWYKGLNQSPARPVFTRKTNAGAVEASLAFAAAASDPDGNQLIFIWDFGDGKPFQRSTYLSSGRTNAVTHAWSLAGSYSIRVRVEDEGGLLSVWSTNVTVTISGVSDPSKFPFESGVMGWTNGGLNLGASCGVPTVSSYPVKFGAQCLKVTVALTNKVGCSNGGVWVNHTVNPGQGQTAGTVNLNGFPWTAWVWVPADAMGSPSSPNGLQVFFRDSSGRYRVFPWQNIGSAVRTNEWFQLRVTNNTSAYAWQDAGFDAVNVAVMGVRINLNSAASYYNGPIYLDGVNWASGNPPNTPQRPWTGVPAFLSGFSNSVYTTATDPNSDLVAYEFDWGDSSPTTMTPFSTSGWIGSARHDWLYSGVFPVRARTLDASGFVSGWSAITNIRVTNTGDDPSRWHFEVYDMGWKESLFGGTTRCTDVRWTDERVFLGNHALGLDFKVLDDGTTNDRGEAEVDMSVFPPNGYSPPAILSLSNVPVTFRYYIPNSMKGAAWVVLQFTLKDINGKLYHAPGLSSFRADIWTNFTFTVGSSTPSYVDAGFNGNQVRYMGVKYSVSSGGGNTGPGTIYLDSISWGMGANAIPTVPTILSWPEAGLVRRPTGLVRARATDSDGDTVSYQFDGRGAPAITGALWTSTSGTFATPFGPTGSTQGVGIVFPTNASVEIRSRAVDSKVGVSAWSAYPRPKIYIGSYPDPGRYNWEQSEGTWTAFGTGATAYANDTTRAFLGTGCLRIDLNTAVGNSAGYYVDALYGSPLATPEGNEEMDSGESNPPVDSGTKKFVIWCYAPTGAKGAGNKIKLIGGTTAGWTASSAAIPYENMWFPAAFVEGTDMTWGATTRYLGIGFECMTAYSGPMYFDSFMWHNGSSTNHSVPSSPSISGTVNASPGSTYSYVFRGSDAKDDPLLYVVNWGDGTQSVSKWTNSGSDVRLSHVFSSTGNYSVRARSVDPVGGFSAESVFSVSVGFSVFLSEASATPSLITNSRTNVVRFRVKSTSLYGKVTNVSIDLSALGGGIVRMTNESGVNSNYWKFGVRIPAGTVGAGLLSFPLSAIDNSGSSANGIVQLTVVLGGMNAAPSVPAAPRVPTSSVTGLPTPVKCFGSTDPTADNIRFNLVGSGYRIDNALVSGPGSSGFGPSGATQTAYVVFDNCASYTLRANAEDVYGGVSSYSPLSTNAPSGWIYVANAADPGRYDWETDDEGFTFDNITGTPVASVARNTTVSRFGSGSLQINLNFTSGASNRGLVWAEDVRYTQFPYGLEWRPAATPVVDFSRRPMSVWAYAPTGAMGTNKTKPNGFRIVFNGDGSGTGYAGGPFIPIPQENEWFLVTGIPNVNDSVQSSAQSAATIRKLGIMFQSQNGSFNTYTGPVYIDTFTWDGRTNRFRSPNKPSAPAGPVVGGIATNYLYTFTGTDPANDALCYIVDWGDGTESRSRWTNSGRAMKLSHSWSAAGTFQVRCRSYDPSGGLSVDSDPLAVNIGSGAMPGLSISKSVTNITLKGKPCPPRPGATAHLRIILTNSGSGTASGAIVWDRLDPSGMFVTNSAAIPSGWAIQWSTNASPNQGYLSPDYSDVQPSPSRLRWIRWKKNAVAGAESVRLTYRIIIR